MSFDKTLTFAMPPSTTGLNGYWQMVETNTQNARKLPVKG